MDVAKVFESGHSQAVRLPKKFRFEEEEVLVQRIGDAVLLTPKDSVWKTFVDGVNSFTDDFLADGRKQDIQQKREVL